MATLQIHDYANQLRFEITGKLSGDCVSRISERWMSALPGSYHRKLTIDISALTGYDQAGRVLLREMYERGMEFSGSTPQSLVYLQEISKPSVSAARTPIRESYLAPKQMGSEQKNEPPLLARAQVSGKQ